MARIAQVRARAAAIAGRHRADPRGLATVAMEIAGKDEQLAFEVFRASPRAVVALSAAQIRSLLPCLHDWNSTDCFGCFVSGVAWREGRLSDRAIAAWTGDDNRWVRRAALVSTVPLNLTARGATAPDGEAGKTLGVCVRLIDDRDDMVVKALSWALRTLAGKDEGAVAGFIERHRDRLAPRVIRETTSKLTTGLKNPRTRKRSASTP